MVGQWAEARTFPSKLVLVWFVHTTHAKGKPYGHVYITISIAFASSRLWSYVYGNLCVQPYHPSVSGLEKQHNYESRIGAIILI